MTTEETWREDIEKVGRVSVGGTSIFGQLRQLGRAAFMRPQSPVVQTRSAASTATESSARPWFPRAMRLEPVR